MNNLARVELYHKSPLLGVPGALSETVTVAPPPPPPTPISIVFPLTLNVLPVPTKFRKVNP